MRSASPRGMRSAWIADEEMRRFDAVDFGLFQLQPFGEGRPSDDGGDREDSLSSDS